jgi:hypothetical protein
MSFLKSKGFKYSEEPDHRCWCICCTTGCTFQTRKLGRSSLMLIIGLCVKPSSSFSWVLSDQSQITTGRSCTQVWITIALSIAPLTAGPVGDLSNSSSIER